MGIIVRLDMAPFPRRLAASVNAPRGIAEDYFAVSNGLQYLFSYLSDGSETAVVGTGRQQCRLGPVRDVKALDDLLHMGLDRAFGHRQGVGDQLVWLTLRDQRQDIALASRQFLPRGTGC